MGPNFKVRFEFFHTCGPAKKTQTLKTQDMPLSKLTLTTINAFTKVKKILLINTLGAFF